MKTSNNKTWERNYINIILKFDTLFNLLTKIINMNNQNNYNNKIQIKFN